MNFTNINSSTNNFLFDRDNYFFIQNIWDPEDLICNEIPTDKGLITYHGSLESFNYDPNGEQVCGSSERYNHPKFKQIHAAIGKKIEKIIGKDLLPTYFFDRFYFVGQELTVHADRPACEISVSVHINSNLNQPWMFEIETPYDENHAIDCAPGDGVIYRGCDAKHWRKPLPSRYNKFQRFIRKLQKKKDDTYYHQIFFHYVLANGHRSHFAYDNCK
jgi:hypothetical protein